MHEPGNDRYPLMRLVQGISVLKDDSRKWTMTQDQTIMMMRNTFFLKMRMMIIYLPKSRIS